MRSEVAPTPEEDARALVAQLREEMTHAINLERVLQKLPAEARSVLHTLTKRARTERISNRDTDALWELAR